MSRSGYVDDLDDPLALGRWRSAVRSALQGKRGQAFLREMLAALDALPEKRLIKGDLEAEATGLPFAQHSDVCALGSVGRARGTDMRPLDPYEGEQIASAFGIAHAMACEIAYINDDFGWRETPELRFERVREWVAGQIKITE